MYFHEFDSNSKLVDCGTKTLEQSLAALELFRGRAESEYKYTEEWFKECCFTISVSKKDFLQVNCDSPEKIWFRSDRLIYDMPWYKKIFCKNTVMSFGGDLSLAKNVIKNYYTLDREKFENTYSNGYWSAVAIGYAKLT
jgi:hypothetical protein